MNRLHNIITSSTNSLKIHINNTPLQQYTYTTRASTSVSFSVFSAMMCIIFIHLRLTNIQKHYNINTHFIPTEHVPLGLVIKPTKFNLKYSTYAH